MSKQPPPAPTVSAVGPCPTAIQIVGRPSTGFYPAPSHHPTTPSTNKIVTLNFLLEGQILENARTQDFMKKMKVLPKNWYIQLSEVCEYNKSR